MIAHFNGIEINPIQNGDAWRICDLCVANADRLKLYFPKTLEQNLNPNLSEIFVTKKMTSFSNKEEFLFTLKQSSTRKIIGLVYIKELNWDTKQGEFAYCIDYNFEAKGITSKAITLLTNYAFTTLGLKTLQIISHKSNTASIKVAEHTNFKWIKTLKNEFTPTGKAPLDMELYERYHER